jgi:hypothetical protein
MNVAMMKPKTENVIWPGEAYREIYSALRRMAGGDCNFRSFKKTP